MANNRLYLIHEESGIAVMLGKRYESGWFDSPLSGKFERFFCKVFDETGHDGMDGFVLYQEITDDWEWDHTTSDGFEVYRKVEE